MNIFLSTIIEKIVSNEGKKFLQLDQGFSEECLSKKENSKPSLYIHIPFCKKLCPYCSFNRYPYQEELAINYFQCLEKELIAYHDLGYRFEEVYIGGGTPTVNISLLLKLFSVLYRYFPIQELSIEANPSDLTKEVIQSLKESHVKRLSIGVQSFNDKLLLEMGRTSHTSSDAVQAIDRCEGNFQTVNIDFIFNFPSQSIEEFEKDIKTVHKVGCNQATFYPLMPSPHKRTALERKFNRVNTQRESRFYEVLVDAMKDTFVPSTCWCFSKGNHMIDEYIIHHPEYIGVGAGSVGFLNDSFFVNTFNPLKYIQKINNQKFPIVLSKESTLKEAARYFMLTQLFGLKMEKTTFSEKYLSSISKELFLLKTAGIVREDDTLYKTTQKGMFYLGIMMKQFFIGLNSLREICIQNKI